MRYLYYILSLTTVTLLTLSCDKEEKKYTDAEAQYIIDSLYREKTKRMIEEARINFEYRNKVELKSPKADTSNSVKKNKSTTPQKSNNPIDTTAG